MPVFLQVALCVLVFFTIPSIAIFLVLERLDEKALEKSRAKHLLELKKSRQHQLEALVPFKMAAQDPRVGELGELEPPPPRPDPDTSKAPFRRPG